MGVFSTVSIFQENEETSLRYVPKRKRKKEKKEVQFDKPKKNEREIKKDGQQQRRWETKDASMFCENRRADKQQHKLSGGGRSKRSRGGRECGNQSRNDC